MSKLQKLIQELCPDGVEYKTLGEIATIKNGRDYKHLGKGNVPVYGSGGIMTYVDTYVYNKVLLWKAVESRYFQHRR